MINYKRREVIQIYRMKVWSILCLLLLPAVFAVSYEFTGTGTTGISSHENHDIHHPIQTNKYSFVPYGGYRSPGTIEEFEYFASHNGYGGSPVGYDGSPNEYVHTNNQETHSNQDSHINRVSNVFIRHFGSPSIEHHKFPTNTRSISFGDYNRFAPVQEHFSNHPSRNVQIINNPNGFGFRNHASTASPTHGTGLTTRGSHVRFSAYDFSPATYSPHKRYRRSPSEDPNEGHTPSYILRNLERSGSDLPGAPQFNFAERTLPGSSAVVNGINNYKLPAAAM